MARIELSYNIENEGEIRSTFALSIMDGDWSNVYRAIQDLSQSGNPVNRRCWWNLRRKKYAHQ